MTYYLITIKIPQRDGNSKGVTWKVNEYSKHETRIYFQDDYGNKKDFPLDWTAIEEVKNP
jgi:hypothetical protein